ncbi:MAG: hypothetical protein JXR56_07375 [Candidatus Cloacimonetes bacterium]|nr:hypothetical protein [Candidatus Cloacimonadota bacterium]
MISLEWKERLTHDVEDFFIHKLPKAKYDIEIIYNVYPIRVNNCIPKEVIVFVAKDLAAKLDKKSTEYIDFYDILWNKKGENGKLVLVYLFARFIKKNPEFFLPLIEAKLESQDSSMVSLLLEKTILVLMKKSPEKYLPLIFKWLKKDNAELQMNILKLLLKYYKNEPENLPAILDKLKYLWLLGSDSAVKGGIYFLKQVELIDDELYVSFFVQNQKTHDPALVEVLCGSLINYHSELVPIVDNWTNSGNARLKKAALAGQKHLKRKGKQLQNG